MIIIEKTNVRTDKTFDQIQLNPKIHVEKYGKIRKI